jgi:hypothetical protein
MKLQNLFLSLAMLSTFAATGCTVYSTPPPATEIAYAETPTPPPPPAPIVEVIPPTPGVEFTWVPGHHRWNGGRYVWVGGYYDRRPHREAHYVHGHWEHRGRVTVWVDGHWG